MKQITIMVVAALSFSACGSNEVNKRPNPNYPKQTNSGNITAGKSCAGAPVSKPAQAIQKVQMVDGSRP